MPPLIPRTPLDWGYLFGRVLRAFHDQQTNHHRCGGATGGASLDPLAYAGAPSINRLHPLFPDTRILNGWSFSSIHSPKVKFAAEALGSICHHLQSLQSPQFLSISSFSCDFGSLRAARPSSEQN